MLTPMTLEVISRPAAERRQPHPLLFVHGAWHGAWCWDEHFLSHFASLGWDAHALSLRGHAGSSGREGLRRHRIKDYVADVGAVVADLGTDTVVIGHSMGGLVVSKYLELYPAPAGALLAAVPLRGVLPLTLRVARRHPALFARANATMSLYPLVGTTELVREMFFSSDLPDDLVRDYQARLGDESYLGYLDMLAFALPRPSRVRSPLLVVGGEDDAMFTVAQVRATGAAYDARTVILPGVAHDVMLDTRWRSVADTLADWLEDTLG